MELNPSINKIFSDYVISLLNKYEIITVIDFIKTDPHKLVKITNLDREVITKLKNDLFGLLKPYEGFVERELIKTGINGFDELIGGGLKTGSLYDICGLSGTGKTQICNTIAINLAINYKYETLYVDAKNDFSGQRIYNMINARKCNDDEFPTIMNRIRYESIYDVHEFLTILRDLPAYLVKHTKVKCLVVDSLPSLWFPLMDCEDNGIGLLCEATNLMHKIAFCHDLIILLINIVTRRTETNYDSSDKSQRVNTKEIVAMGKYWHTVPRQRFLLTRADDSNSQAIGHRIIKILERAGKGKSCCVNITNKGVV